MAESIPVTDIANDLIKQYTEKGEEGRVIAERAAGAILGIQELVKALAEYQNHENTKTDNKDDKKEEKSE